MYERRHFNLVDNDTRHLTASEKQPVTKDLDQIFLENDNLKGRLVHSRTDQL